MTIRRINPPELGSPPGYSHVVEAAGRFVFIAGQTAVDADGHVIGEGDSAAPAVTLVEVSRLYGADFFIEIEAIAVAP